MNHCVSTLWMNMLTGSGCLEAVLGRHWDEQTERSQYGSETQFWLSYSMAFVSTCQIPAQSCAAFKGMNMSSYWGAGEKLIGTLFMCSFLLGVHLLPSRCGKEVPWSSKEQNSRLLSMPWSRCRQLRIDFSFADAGAQLNSFTFCTLICFYTLRTASPVQSEHRTQDRAVELHVLGRQICFGRLCWEIWNLVIPDTECVLSSRARNMGVQAVGKNLGPPFPFCDLRQVSLSP